MADNATTGKIKVTTPKGDTTSTANLTINPTPEPELQDVSPGSHPPFSNCNRSLSYTITVKNISNQRVALAIMILIGVITALILVKRIGQ